MRVTAQYAQEHFSDLVSAVDRGEEIEIGRPDKPTLRLVVAQAASEMNEVRPRSELFGVARGTMHLAHDWDSADTNGQIADLFEKSELFPECAAE